MDIEIKPVDLNEGEKDFEEYLIKYYHEDHESFESTGLFLLPNRSQGSGNGFFEAGKFCIVRTSKYLIPIRANIYISVFFLEQ